MALTLTSFTAGTTIKSSDVNFNFNAINTELFDITDANIASNAAIQDSKLATIGSANKVNGSAIVSQSIDAVKGQFIWTANGDLVTGPSTPIGFPYRASAVLTMVECRIEVLTAPTTTSDTLTIDIRKNDTTVFGTMPTIVGDGATFEGSSTDFSITTLAEGDKLEAYIFLADDDDTGADLVISLWCEQKVPQ